MIDTAPRPPVARRLYTWLTPTGIDPNAHAFRTGKDFMRSLCERVRWTVKLHAGFRAAPCPDCAAIVRSETHAALDEMNQAVA